MYFLPAQMLMLILQIVFMFVTGKHTEIYIITALLCDQQSAACGVRIHDNVLSGQNCLTVPGAVIDKRGTAVE